jgi:hypothetical protein
VHAVPHTPQFAAEVFRSTHAPEHAVMPVEHIGIWMGGGLLQATSTIDSASRSLMGRRSCANRAPPSSTNVRSIE